MTRLSDLLRNSLAAVNTYASGSVSLAALGALRELGGESEVLLRSFLFSRGEGISETSGCERARCY